MIKIKNRKYTPIEEKKEKKARQRLSKIITGYENWWNNKGEERNQEARKKLIEFCKEYKKYKPSTYYETGQLTAKETHTSYMQWLIDIKEALDEGLYMRACSELGSLMHYESIFQRRIYYNLIYLLESSLDLHTDNV